MNEELEKYRKMHKDILILYNKAEEEMEKLKMEGKTKSITFRETMGKKGFYSRVLSMYTEYGLKMDE